MLATWKLTLYCFCVLIVAARSRDAARNRGKPPLIEEPRKKSKTRPTHCTFGNLTYELEERWRPDLGPPFGVLYCVRCECTAVRKKKRVTAKVRCRNIKYDCPKLTCHNPVLLPARCCKTCPGQDYADLEEDLASKKFEDEEDDTIKEFSALLTGRGLMPNVQTGAAARGYAILNKRNLHYTIHYSGLDFPTSVRFIDDEGTILAEQEVNALPKYINDSKVCGAWRNLPKIYRRLLHKDRLHIVLVTPEHPDGEVAGKLMKNMRFNTEVYSSLLLSDDINAGSGGIAMIAPVQDNVHVIIDFNGVFTPKDSHNVAVFIRINNRDENTLLAEAVVIMPKVNPEHNRANVKMKLTAKLQKLLSEGKLEMTINSTDETKTLRGQLIVKPTCNVFQAVLTPEKILENKAVQTMKPAGFVLFSINSDGTLNYKLHVIDLEHAPSSILFQTDSEEGIDLGEIDHLNFLGGWANGTFMDTTSQVIEMLMTDDLYLSVSTSDHQNELRGRVRQRLYTDAFISEMPLLLSSKGNSSAAGIAWLSVDKDCFLHYEVDVSNLDQEGGKSDRHLVEILQKSDYNSRQQVLKKLDGDEVGDMTDMMAIYTLKSGNSQVLITTKSGREKSIELKGTIEKIYVPANCLLRSDPMHRSSFPYMEDGSNEVLRDSLQCYYEGKVFTDGTQWKAEHNPCWMCSCQRGKVVCDSIICPPTTCNNPIILQTECCPICHDFNINVTAEETARGCYFEGDKKFHVAGSQWHPYLPPFGFSTCAVCTCQPDTLTVECQKTSCPPLPCPDHKAVRADPLACCKTCKNEVLEPSFMGQIFGGTLGDQAKIKPKDIILEGGCKTRGQIFANGAEWHPTVQPFGEMKCINCHCKDGQSKCRRQKCPKLSCDAKIYDENECCPRCQENGKLYNENHPSKKEKRKWKSKNKRQISTFI